jgi:hypothetical protein
VFASALSLSVLQHSWYLLDFHRLRDLERQIYQNILYASNSDRISLIGQFSELLWVGGEEGGRKYQRRRVLSLILSKTNWQISKNYCF